MRRVATAVSVLTLTVGASLAGCNKNPGSTSPDVAAVPANAPHALPPAAAAPAEDGNWTMPGKNFASTRFSGLAQITPGNVSKLGLSFTFSTATTQGYQAPPLVVNGTMYLITPYPNNL